MRGRLFVVYRRRDGRGGPELQIMLYTRETSSAIVSETHRFHIMAFKFATSMSTTKLRKYGNGHRIDCEKPRLLLKRDWRGLRPAGASSTTPVACSLVVGNCGAVKARTCSFTLRVVNTITARVGVNSVVLLKVGGIGGARRSRMYTCDAVIEQEEHRGMWVLGPAGYIS